MPLRLVGTRSRTRSRAARPKKVPFAYVSYVDAHECIESLINGQAIDVVGGASPGHK